jgi:hypothetical protein
MSVHADKAWNITSVHADKAWNIMSVHADNRIPIMSGHVDKTGISRLIMLTMAEIIISSHSD